MVKNQSLSLTMLKSFFYPWMRIEPYVFFTSTLPLKGFHLFTFIIDRAAIIYSHGNAADCGSMLPRCMQMSERLEMDIILYDYEGYGYSVGQPSGDSIRTDIEIVYHYVLKHFDSRKVFLYGESSTIRILY